MAANEFAPRGAIAQTMAGFLGAAYVLTRRLWLPIGIHASHGLLHARQRNHVVAPYWR